MVNRRRKRAGTASDWHDRNLCLLDELDSAEQGVSAQAGASNTQQRQLEVGDEAGSEAGSDADFCADDLERHLESQRLGLHRQSQLHAHADGHCCFLLA